MLKLVKQDITEKKSRYSFSVSHSQLYAFAKIQRDMIKIFLSSSEISTVTGLGITKNQILKRECYRKTEFSNNLFKLTCSNSVFFFTECCMCQQIFLNLNSSWKCTARNCIQLSVKIIQISLFSEMTILELFYLLCFPVFNDIKKFLGILVQ